MKNQKGITLVALVITIVVLLILAGVTISMVLGPNGVLTNSQTAKDNSAKGTANDALSTALSSLSTSYYTEAHDSDATLLSTVTAENLKTLAPGYTYTVNGTTITMTSEKDGYVFTATITDTLTVNSFTSNKD